MSAALASRASTTRYWDCSGGSCGCGYGKSGTEIHCESNSLFHAPHGNPHGASFYGGAAVSDALGGGSWLPKACGKCFKLTAKANVPGHSHTSTSVVKATNYCPPSNPACSGGRHHFDIAAPGFDYPPQTLHNTCSKVVSHEKGLYYPPACGWWMIHS